MEKYEFLKLLNEYTMDSGEVKEVLGVNRSYLSRLKDNGRLIPIKGNLYWRDDVEMYLKSRKRPYKPIGGS